jgi:hypothetical protein
MPERVLWIGLVHFRPLPACDRLDGDPGLFSNIITWARDAREFREKAEILAVNYALFVVEVDDEEPLTLRPEECDISEGLEELADGAMHDPGAILF